MRVLFHQAVIWFCIAGTAYRAATGDTGGAVRLLLFACASMLTLSAIGDRTR